MGRPACSQTSAMSLLNLESLHRTKPGESSRKQNRLGMQIKVHADEFESSGGAALAVELGATSADHLGAITDADIHRIAASTVIATFFPTLFMLGKTHYAGTETDCKWRCSCAGNRLQSGHVSYLEHAIRIVARLHTNAHDAGRSDCCRHDERRLRCPSETASGRSKPASRPISLFTTSPITARFLTSRL